MTTGRGITQRSQRAAESEGSGLGSGTSSSLHAAADTVGAFINAAAVRLEAAGLWFGHGSDNARDEAAELVFFAAGLRHEDAPRAYKQHLTKTQRDAAAALIQRRIVERRPAAYLTQRMWFAGLEFYVDERVLVPRSPFAELIERRFEPWLQPSTVHRILDIGTGSGCIAIASAHAFPNAHVDAADISEEALQVTRINIDKHNLGARVHAVRADVWPECDDASGAAVDGGRYDLIVSNPPYVSHAEMAALPQEYLHEPELGLRAGEDGLDIVRRILAGAPDRLALDGLLAVEVGDSEHNLQAAYPQVPFTWLEFERGGGGVFTLTGQDMVAYADELRAEKPRSRGQAKK